MSARSRATSVQRWMSAELRPGSSIGSPSTVMRIRLSAERILRPQLAGDRRDLDALVVVEHRELVVDDLDDDVGGVALEEARVHHVVGRGRSRAPRARPAHPRARAPPRSSPWCGAHGRRRARCRRRTRWRCVDRGVRCPCSRRSAAARWSCRRRRPWRDAGRPRSPAGSRPHRLRSAAAAMRPHGGS